MARRACERQNGRTRNEDGTLHRDAIQQSPLHDALLHPALRICSESSLHQAPYLLHRPPDLRPAHPHLLLHRDHADCARDHGPESHNPGDIRRLGDCRNVDHLRCPNFSVDPLRLPARLVLEHAQIFRWRLHLFFRPRPRLRRDLFHHPRNPMNKKMLPQILFFLVGASAALAGPQMIAFERKDAVWIANLDGTGEKKIADGIFPAISPDGTRVAFNTVEKTSDPSYARHMAVVDVANGNVTVFKDVPSDNSYYPRWSADGKQILFTTRPKEVWDLVTINADGTNFRVLKPGEQNAVTRYSPIW